MEPLEILTLAIAGAGFVLSVIALTWQMVAWRYTGSVVKAVVSPGFYTMDDGSIGPSVMSVEARNVGRTVVSITGWGFQLPTGETIIQPFGPPWAGPRLPHTLDPGHSESWRMEVDALRGRLAREGRPGGKLRGFVNLGTGQKKLSKPFRV